MNAIVDPDGPKLAVVASNPVPQGARVSWLKTPDNVRLRYATFPKGPGPARGTICLVHGRTEFIEKYFETIADLQARGFAVATFDWRGQGASDRLIRNRALGHVRHYDDYVADLMLFHREVLLPDCPGPYHLVGHSMSGLVCLEVGRRDRMMFERIFLSAPMLGLDNQPLDTIGMARVAKALTAIGLGRLPVGRKSDGEQSVDGFAGNPLTSDLARYTRNLDVLKAAPELAVGNPTIGWVAAAYQAMARSLEDSFPTEVKIPVLMLAAARDEIVSIRATETLGLRMRTGRHLIVPGARHELFMESDAIRGQVLAAFDAFVTEASLA
jgi:lysophospholipase